jgi:hypothetical protein
VSIRKIIVCYELAIDLADLYRGYAEHEIAPPSRKIAKHALHRIRDIDCEITLGTV